MSSAEPMRSRWNRRVRTIPLMLAVTTLGVVLSPAVLGSLAIGDVLRRRRKLPSVRVALFLLQYGINDCVEIGLAPLLWMRAGFGRRLDTAASIARYERLQGWSLDVLARRAERLLGLRIDIDEGSAAALLPCPAIVLCRHVNLVDASLPALLYRRLGHRTRGVIMAELLADPGFDLVYPNAGSVFIPRDNGPEAVQAIGALAGGLDERTAVVIYPEGRLFRPDRLERAQQRLVDQQPVRATRLASLRNVLPPRPGGVLTLLGAADADVVVMAHAGLDRYASFRELARAVPLTDPITVTAWRTRRSDLPSDPDGQAAWLDTQWVAVDAWVAERR